MSELNAGDGYWTAVRVGPTVVGWVGSHLEHHRLLGDKSHITVMMGNTEYRLSVSDFQLHCMDRIETENSALMRMLSYRKQFAVPVPNGSLDVTAAGEIDYTFRSGETLIAALTNFFNALATEVQADLHTRTPVEVVRKFAELISCRYLPALGEKLTWRGILLDDILNQNTTMKVKVVRQAYLSTRYNGFFEVQNLPSTRAFGSLGSTGFGSFVDWQVRSIISPTRVFPENVIHVRAESLEEYALAEELFDTRSFLPRYISKTRPDATDVSCFLSMIGDPLEKWLDGETIRMEEFLMVAAELDESLQQPPASLGVPLGRDF